MIARPENLSRRRSLYVENRTQSALPLRQWQEI